MNINTDLVSIFNQLSLKSILSLKDMIDGQDYFITKAKRINTKYGDVIVLELDSKILYLPKRFNSLTDKDIENLSTGVYSISKISSNDDKANDSYKLEMKVAYTLRDYYNNNEFQTFK